MSPRRRWPHRRRPRPYDLPPDVVEPPPPDPTVPLPAAPPPVPGPPGPPPGPPPPGAPPPPFVDPAFGPPYEEPPPDRALWPWLLLFGVLVIGALAIAWAATRGGDEDTTKTVVVVRTVVVPPVVGKSEGVAVTRLTRLGLEPAVTHGADPEPAGTVVHQEPGAGAKVRRGSVVRLAVSTGPKGPAGIRVPNVVGLTSTRAIDALRTAGLRAQTTTESSDKPAGTVIAESPAAGSEVVKNSVVTLTVSKGPEEVAVPDLVGQSEDDARASLRSAGLVASVFRVTSDKPTGIVVAQDPKAGERLAKGGKVRVNVSKGAPAPPPTTTTTPPVTTVTTTATTTRTTTTTTETTATTRTTTTTSAPPATTTVPDVRGKSQTQARHALRQVGLVAAVAYVHGQVPFDQVVAQFPKPGASAKRGDRVRINVSLGPTPRAQRAVPDVTSEDETSATQRLRAAGFTVETVDQVTDDGSADAVVLSQDPAGGTRAPRGSTVTIFVGRFSG